jgi:hypothetical protein
MNLVERVKKILLSPEREWETIRGENYTAAELFTQYAMILAAIPALAGFIGLSLIGYSFGLGTFRLPIGYGLTHCVLNYVLSLVGVYLLAMIMDRLSPNFGASKDMDTALKISVFSMTPFWVGGIFLIIPSLSVITMIAGLYSLYLLFLGIKQLKDVPPGTQIGFFLIITLVTIIIQVIIRAIVHAGSFPGPMM